MDLLVILIGGAVVFVAACFLEFIITGVLGIVLVPTMEPGFGVPFRFAALGLPVMSNNYFSLAKLLLDWLIWCVIFAPLFYGVRALFRQ